ncbi:hypothetical protein CANARDRAFT_7962 [[Candida] arabinofermentans NRRL YB-2248]|uniref:Major facilitator superfamily (MFS) profile domain-containing protein n=1 Tax=[Candida] arabinofermentans NRRL YB-2248 TaxID=983967 RepID=A0A1E4T0P4_9ASCO|nr:hypothetical protein CANARDRAFT_7962 [[Candida] arabinofermentans NRRL YB-2248]
MYPSASSTVASIALGTDKREEVAFSSGEIELDHLQHGRSSAFFKLKRNLNNLKSKTPRSLSHDNETHRENSFNTINSNVDASESPIKSAIEDDNENENDPTELKYPEGGWKAYSVVLASLLGMVSSFGLMNSTGAIESYLEKNTLKTTSTTTISWIFALFSFLTFGGSMVSGVLFDTYGAKRVVIPGSIMLVGGLMATASSTTTWQFILSFGICCGTASSMLLAPLVSCIGHFFNKKRGLALGIAMPGASLGGVIWPQVCRSLYGKIGFPWTMRVIGFCFLGCLGVVCLLVDDRTEEIRKHNAAVEGTDPTVRPSVWKQLRTSVDFHTLKDKTFMSLVLALFFNEFSLILSLTYIPSYAISKGYSESISLTALTAVNGAGILGRYVPSHLSDSWGKFNMISLMSCMMTLVIFVLWLPFGYNIGAFFTFCVFFGFSVAGTLSLSPLCTSAISKPRDMGKRYGTAYFFVSFGNLMSLPIGSAITQTPAGYNGMAAFAGGTSAVATISFLYTRYRLAGLKKVKI